MAAPDPASPLAAKIAAALRMNEIGTADPYTLSYAGLGNSGPSFGTFQGDVAANPHARSVLSVILITAGVSPGRTATLTAQLARPCKSSPLGAADDTTVLQAIASESGRALVDQMDASILAAVLREVGTSIDAAEAAGLSIEDGAVCAIALWCNMTGAPTTLNRWLGGEAIDHGPGRTVAPPAGPTVGLPEVLAYLSASDYFTAHPRNLAHLQGSVAIGLAASDG